MDKKKILVMLDPGHGINTPGKKSLILDNSSILYEYAFVRDITYAVYNKLTLQGYRCYITHPELEEISNTSKDLSLRVLRANEQYQKEKSNGNTAIFISIHVNASGNGYEWCKAKGWSVWTSVGLTQGDKLATVIYNEAKKILEPLNQKVRLDLSDGDPDYESNFYVLKNTNCPACLTENMFMDNKENTEWLLSDEGRNAIINLHVNGIKEYIKNL